MMLTSLLRDILMLLTTLFPISKFVPSHPFLVVMIAVKDTKSVSFLKLEPFISTGSTNDFLFFYPFIVSVFVQQGRTKAVTSHIFTPLFMFIHLFLHLIMHYYALLCICYCFSHLIILLSVTWLSLLYKFTRFFIYFLFLSDEGPMLEMLDYTILYVLAVHRPFYISICTLTRHVWSA